MTKEEWLKTRKELAEYLDRLDEHLRRTLPWYCAVAREHDDYVMECGFDKTEPTREGFLKWKKQCGYVGKRARNRGR